MKLNKPTSIFFILFAIIISFNNLNAQQKTKGRYIPTKFDSVKKVIPPQYYGNPIEAKRKDSIAKAEAQRKLQEEQQRIEQAKKEAELAKQKKAGSKKVMLDKLNQKETQKETTSKAQKVKTIKEEKNETPKTEPKPIVKHEVEKKVVSKYSNKQLWTMLECIQYALDNNLQVAEAELNKKFDELLLEENKNKQYPDLNGDIYAGKSFGRNIDPATNVFTTKNFNYGILDFNSKTLLFGWFQKKYENERLRLNIEANSAQKEQLENDIALNITVGFIRVLQAREATKIIQNKIQKTLTQLNSSSYQFKNYIETTLANDSLQYLQSKNAEKISLLELKALMNLTSSNPFDIQTTQVENEWFKNYQQISNVQDIVTNAINNNPLIYYNELKLLSSQKSLEIAKSKQYPSLSLYGNLGSVYSSSVKKMTSQYYEGVSQIGYVNINGTSYPVTQPEYYYTYQTQGLFNQFSDHIRAGVALGLNIPIINGYQIRVNMQKAKINMVYNQMLFDRQKQKLSQDVLMTYENIKLLQKEYIASQNVSKKNLNLFNSVSNKTITSSNEFIEWNQFSESYLKSLLNENEKKYQLLFKLKMLDYFVDTPLTL